MLIEVYVSGIKCAEDDGFDNYRDGIFLFQYASYSFAGKFAASEQLGGIYRCEKSEQGAFGCIRDVRQRKAVFR